ncbi:MAG TPA: hypothetical protein DD381_07620 [Lentisphaeria bacterium]|nr:hypothetical protein [Lentisphaeria bacterium]
MSEITIPTNISLKLLKAFKSQTKMELIRALQRVQEYEEDLHQFRQEKGKGWQTSLVEVKKKNGRQLRGRPCKHREHYLKVLYFISAL